MEKDQRYAIQIYDRVFQSRKIWYYTSKEKRDTAFNNFLNAFKTKKGCCIDYANDNEFKVYTPFDPWYTNIDRLKDEYDVYMIYSKIVADEICIDIMNLDLSWMK